MNKQNRKKLSTIYAQSVDSFVKYFLVEFYVDIHESI